MNILFYCPFRFSLNSFNIESLGGIETLNLQICKELANKKNDIYLATYCNKIIKRNNIINIPIRLLLQNVDKYNFDMIISSNDPAIFNYFKSSDKFLWLHNKLQIEKSIRKGKFFSILKNDIISIFVSRYLEKKTAQIYNFKKRTVIPNFLDPRFENLRLNKNRKPYFVWSVQRTKGLDELISQWKENIFFKNKKAKLFIFGLNKKSLNNYNIINLSKFNIYFKGRVKKKQLIKYYTNSMGMICLGYDETFCINVIEAFACGLPVITFGFTAVSELVNNKNSFKMKNFNNFDKIIFNILKMKISKRKQYINYCFEYSKKYHLKKILPIWKKTIGS